MHWDGNNEGHASLVECDMAAQLPITRHPARSRARPLEDATLAAAVSRLLNLDHLTIRDGQAQLSGALQPKLYGFDDIFACLLLCRSIRMATFQSGHEGMVSAFFFGFENYFELAWRWCLFHVCEL